MTRSRRKPYWIDDSCKKAGKRFANRRIRNTEDVPQYGKYKRLYETWDLCDYRSYSPKDAKVYRK